MTSSESTAAIFMVRETSVATMLPKRGVSLLPGKTLLRFAKSTVSSGGLGDCLETWLNARGFATGTARMVPETSSGAVSLTILLMIRFW